MPKSIETISEERIALEEHLKAVYGEVSDELDKLWTNNGIELREKLDNYGEAIRDIEMTVTMLQDKKKAVTKRITDAINHLQNEVRKMKNRLFAVGEELDEKHLRGYNHSFHPFISRTKDSIDTERVENEYKRYQLPKLSYAEYNTLLGLIRESELLIEFIKNNTKEEYLPPKGHPSIQYKLERSVRVT